MTRWPRSARTRAASIPAGPPPTTTARRRVSAGAICEWLIAVMRDDLKRLDMVRPA
ncbi:hypothetical protein [Azospirillum humicireducens]|uniref:hypothetical protein n=1 Tax=Azospirillum humicireducens TaxID=1226968 RepID=UPI0030033805